jgi:hypothetical protein
MQTVFLALVAWLALCTAGLAEGLADCKSEAFRTALKLEPGYGFDCVEIARVTPPVDGARWTIRALRNASTDESYVKSYADEYMAAASAAFLAWEPYVSGLGFNYGNVSIVFTDPEGSEVDFLSLVVGHGYLLGAAHADGFSFPQDCIVSVNMELMTKQEVAAIRSNIAHELFHCVQFWSLPAAALTPGGGNQAWWQEGTANFFTALAVPDAKRTAVDAAAFLSSINTKPLTLQAYHSTIFFAFLNQQGMSTLDAFFKGLATKPGEMAQMQATEQALGDKMLQEFAEAVVDGTIALPSGYVFPALENPVPQVFSVDGQFEASKTSFTIDARLLSFIGGSFAVADGARYGVRKSEGGPWGDMPNLVEPVTCSEPVEFLATRFVGTSIAETMGAPFIATRYAECHVCQALTEADQCLVGKWKLRNDSLLSYLKLAATDMKDVRYSSVAGTIILSVTPDGKAQWITDGLDIGAQITVKELFWDIDIEVEMDGIVSGRWSTGGSEMHFCAEGVDATYTSRVRMPGMEEDVVTESLPPQDSYMTYECSPNALTAVFTGPQAMSGPSPSWTMDRIK